ncbi:MAG: hypothetical protein MZV65_53700 [Chromatiales bacterium]|nr:hypothetical protein [Chromatiales bacterium]
MPAREIEVDLLQASNGAVLATGATDGSGNFALQAPQGTRVFLRAKRAIAAYGHDGTARPAGTSRCATTPTPTRRSTCSTAARSTPASDRPGAQPHRRDRLGRRLRRRLHRACARRAPFAVLDTLYAAVQFVIAQGDCGRRSCRRLSAYWSPDNRPFGRQFVPVDGDIGTTLVPGRSGHSAGHLRARRREQRHRRVRPARRSRTSSITTSRTRSAAPTRSAWRALARRAARHARGVQRGLSPNAFAGMVLNDPVYRDSFGAAQEATSTSSMETGAATVAGLVQRGVGPAHRLGPATTPPTSGARRGVARLCAPVRRCSCAELRNDVPLTSLFPFITRAQAAAERAGGAGRRSGSRRSGWHGTTSASSRRPWTPTRRPKPTAASATGLGGPRAAGVHADRAQRARRGACSAPRELTGGRGDRPGSYNKLGNRRFLRFSVPAAAQRHAACVRLRCCPCPAYCTGGPRPDPDFVVLARSSQVTGRASAARH